MEPPFDADGNLPPGQHEMTWDAVVSRFGGSSRRQRQLEGLKAAIDALQIAGCRTVYLDGSFVTEKESPGDFDVCWSIDGVDPEKLDPVLLTFDPGRKTQKANYGGELFPAQVPADAAGTVFLDFFQIDKRTGRPKGIVVLRFEHEHDQE